MRDAVQANQLARPLGGRCTKNFRRRPQATVVFPIKRAEGLEIAVVAHTRRAVRAREQHDLTRGLRGADRRRRIAIDQLLEIALIGRAEGYAPLDGRDPVDRTRQKTGAPHRQHHQPTHAGRAPLDERGHDHQEQAQERTARHEGPTDLRREERQKSEGHHRAENEQRFLRWCSPQ